MLKNPLAVQEMQETWVRSLSLEDPLVSLLGVFNHSFYFSVCDCSVHSLYFFLYQFLETVSFYGEGNGTPFQYSCLENPIDRGG